MKNDINDLLESIPGPVRKRIATLSLELDDLEELRQEASKLLLYDAIYGEVDAEYDLNHPMLSRAVRGCVDHGGRVPEGADREALLHSCPRILDAIEAAYTQASSGS